ncbi:tetratricopeptide repeat protein [Oharaeibacter diazotrophicus]|uniref:Tetratricopeptide repeat protein n=1 Tax=Oharaeibacter diazotrophicus TaxID=1920512 RepID=A0A4R6RDC1_9HYPH|nr:tetratricopeptide repeat protein [Oharaeibacter diazotrophicus]TDP84180.1 tetratricopeptide repeat protein [Oharaeibacter diazotrophicus]BBE73218.1 hypothetical protein OHA_1_02827 [Pleomorphomonas sp. SM30]GLS75009.1 hypothetical protein GCM10007904_03440 [Oharaeibacter diazotrophicus]
MGWISDECLDKLCGLVTGTLLIGGGLAVGGGLLPVGVGVAEAAVGAVGLATTMLRGRGKDPQAVYARARKAIAAGVRQQLDAEQPGWAEQADAEAAVLRLADVADRISFEAGALVALDLKTQDIVRFLMLRAAGVEPLFHPETGNDTYRTILAATLRETFATLRADAGFWESLRPAIDEETFARLTSLIEGQTDMLGLLRDVDATTRRTEIKVDELVDHHRAERVERAEDRAMLAEILARMRAQDAPTLAAAAQAGIPEATIIEIARRILPTIEDSDSALRELEKAVAVAIRVAEEGRHGTNLGAFIDDILARVAALSREARFEAAIEVADDAFAAWEHEEVTRRAEEEERRARSREAGTRLLRAAYDQAVLARDVRSAAERLVRIVDLEHADPESRHHALRAVQDENHVEGRDRGTRLPLEISIELARIGLARASNPDERGAMCNDLGTALAILGAREAGTARLDEAVAAYRAALEERSRERVPLDWAMTLNNLGSALAILGAREAGTARLEEAVAAYRAALEERTRERVPLDWAATQNNLGNALRTLGEREAGAARVEEAVAAYRAALEERTRERVPLDWAMTLNNLGNVLVTLGEREAGTGRLEEAVAAYRASLEELTRERVPFAWATTQNNLGDALRSLGEREAGTARLKEAVAAFRAALEVRTRERMPLYWAVTQHNLALACLRFFERTRRQNDLDAALTAMERALEVFRGAQVSHYFDLTIALREAILAARDSPPPGASN